MICRLTSGYTESSSTRHDDFLTGYDMDCQRQYRIGMRQRLDSLAGSWLGNEALVREWE